MPKLVPEVGFEPTRAKRPAELESAPLDHSGIQATTSICHGEKHQEAPAWIGQALASATDRRHRPVPVAQLDKASDYESEDWGFKSPQECFFNLLFLFLFNFVNSMPTGAGRLRWAQCQGLESGVLAQLEACVLSKDEVLGSKPRYSTHFFFRPPRPAAPQTPFPREGPRMTRISVL